MKRICMWVALAVFLAMPSLPATAQAGWYNVTVRNNTEHDIVFQLYFRDWKPWYTNILLEGVTVRPHSTATLSPNGAFCPSLIVFYVPPPNCKACRAQTDRYGFGCWGTPNDPGQTCCTSSSWVVDKTANHYDIRKQ